MTDARQRLESTTFTPFSRLALAHALSVSGDVFVTVSLADTLFFSAVTADARPKVLLYLLVTMLPFAVVAPVLGPMLDRTRSGRRILIALSCAGRAVLCILMARDVDSLYLYPLAFMTLVLSKGQSVAKSALVPGVVGHPDELVTANSRLALIAVLGGTISGPVAAVILKTVGADWVLRTGAVVFVVAALASLNIPRAKKVGAPETAVERQALHTPSIVAAGTAMGILRGVVGFTTFFAVFMLKGKSEPAWMYGAVLLSSALGNGLGTVIAPLLRRRVREEWILAGVIAVPALPLIFAARDYSRFSLVFAAAAIAGSASCGRLAFDSLLQRDGADAAHGHAFARFETRFQIAWVIGGVLAVLFSFQSSGRAGIFFVAVVLLFAGLSYIGAVRRLDAPSPPGEAKGEPARRRPPRLRSSRRQALRRVPGRKVPDAGRPAAPPPAMPPIENIDAGGDPDDEPFPAGG